MAAGPMKNEGIPSLRVPIFQAIVGGIERLTLQGRGLGWPEFLKNPGG